MQIIIFKWNGDIFMKLEYTKCRNYYLPNIVMSQESKETKGKHFSKYGLIKLFKRA